MIDVVFVRSFRSHFANVFRNGRGGDAIREMSALANNQY